MINKLTEKIRKTHAPICVGLDPMLSYVPKQVQETAFKEYGETLEGAAEAIWQFNKASDSSLHVKKCNLYMPHNSDVNWVTDMKIEQEYTNY